jgi:hypothetical protein
MAQGHGFGRQRRDQRQAPRQRLVNRDHGFAS